MVKIEIALHTWGGYVASFYERDMATVSSQRTARRVDRQKATHHLRKDRKQGRKSKVSIRSEWVDTDRPQTEGKPGHIILREWGRRERERHYRQIILISTCVCALRARFSGRKSICTTNSVHSGNRTKCTLHIYSIDRALVIAWPWYSYSYNTRWLNLLKLELINIMNAMQTSFWEIKQQDNLNAC